MENNENQELVKDDSEEESTTIKSRRSRKHSIGFYIGCGGACILLAMIIAITVYVNIYYKSTKSIGEYAKESDMNIVEDDDIICITDSSASKKSTTGIIMYPGGKVEYSAYIPLMERIAQEGVEGYIVKMPCNLAILNSDAADRVFDSISESDNKNDWYLMGHSLGGAVATKYLTETSRRYAGAILLGAYPMKDMSKLAIRLLSITGTLDGVVNRDKQTEGKALAPANTKYIDLEGANHAGYGNYGFQKGDNEAAISAEQQQNKTAEAIIDFIFH